MVAAEKTLSRRAEEIAVECPECQGAGTVRYWNEVAYFEDRRACPRCEAGGRIDAKIADLVRRAQLEERLSGR